MKEMVLPMTSTFNKFELRSPHPQNMLDIFKDHWASDFARVLPGLHAGNADHFVADDRPQLAAVALGRIPGRFDGMHILELGPLEAGHTYQLERLGAESVVAIEANIEAYLKCLIVKELLNLRQSRFLLGDMVEFLGTSTERYDLVFASGVLYHMSDPLRLLESIARRTNRCFLWTHYYDTDHYRGPPRTPVVSAFRDIQITFFEMEYGDMDYEKFWGGIRPKNVWMTRGDLLMVLASIGFSRVEVLRDDPDHANGACLTIAASKDDDGT